MLCIRCAPAPQVIAFLEGLCAEELRPGELDHRDPDYELVITLVATKP